MLLKKNVPLYARLPEADQEELKRHILVFMAEKRFEGCGGLRMTDQIKITIAAHACILLLHRKTDYYPGLKSILVYPRAYVAANTRHFGDGIILESEDVRLGESWHHGSVVLSWDDVRRSAADVHDGQNVVFHEFAHQLDSSGGRGDSTPVLRDRSSFIAWARSLGEDFENFQRDYRGRPGGGPGRVRGHRPGGVLRRGDRVLLRDPEGPATDVSQALRGVEAVLPAGPGDIRLRTVGFAIYNRRFSNYDVGSLAGRYS